MTISHIYQRFQIMPSLQLHHWRVAGVALDYLLRTDSQLNQEEIVAACLLHDLGNIAKFELARFPEFLEPEGFEYWQDVQQTQVQKYGSDEHATTLAMAKEIGVPQRVLELIDAIGFSHTKPTFESGDLAMMLCEYADDRVTPFGVVSLADRIEDLRIRYSPRYPGAEQEARRQEFVVYAQKIEQELFSNQSLKPDDITNSSIEKHLLELQAWDILTT